MSPIRTKISPSSLHQTNDSSHSPYPEFGNTNCHLPRRHSHLTSGSTIYLQEGREPSRETGIPHQPEQMFSVPISAAYLLGNNAQHCHNVPVLADREAGSHPTGRTPATYQRQDYTAGVSSTPRTHAPCSSEVRMAFGWILCITSEGSFSWDPKISWQGIETVSRTVTRGYEGCGGTPEHQYATPQVPTSCRFGHPHRCIPFGLVGGNSRQHLHQGKLEPRGVTVTYQCTGAQSSISSNPSFH